MDTASFGSSIKKARIGCGMSAMELAEAVGCSYTNIKLIEEKGQCPRLDLADRMLNALGLRLVLGAEKSRRRLEV